MDVKEIVGKVAKGVCSLVLILLLMRGFEFGFSSNWLLSIGIILGGTLFLYLWGLQGIGKYLWKRKLLTIGAILIGCLFVAMLSESRELSGLAIVENYLVGFVIGIPMAGFFLVLARITFGITKHGRRQVSNYTGSFASSIGSYSSSNKWDKEREERERKWREADQRAKDRYDARTNQLKAEYDARTAAGWGKTGAVRNFCNDADYWKKQQKKY